jgi:hypothetical protein
MTDSRRAKIEAGCRELIPGDEPMVEGILAFASGVWEFRDKIKIDNPGDPRTIIGTEHHVYLLRRSRWSRYRAKELLASWPLGEVPFGGYWPEIMEGIGIPMAVIEIDHARHAVIPESRKALAALLARNRAAAQ